MSLGNGCGNSDVSEWCDVCETPDVKHGRVLDGDIFGYNDVHVSNSLMSLVSNENSARDENSVSVNISRVFI